MEPRIVLNPKGGLSVDGDCGWTLILGDETVDRALKVCQGSYQEGLVLGRENYSGSSLSGKAKKWSGRYAESRGSLIRKLEAAGLYVAVGTGTHCRRILIVSDTPIRAEDKAEGREP